MDFNSNRVIYKILTNMPEVSVVMPVYNQERYVGDAIASILRQSYTDFEFIIVDDGSTDRTLEIIERYEDNRIRLIRAPHNGFIGALTQGIAEAKGKWIARMDSDDICRPDRLETQLAFLNAHPECVFVTTYYGIVTLNDKYLTPARSSEWHCLTARDISLATRPFCDPGTVFDRKMALEIGYDDQFNWEKTIWYELLRRGKGAVLEDPLYFMRWRLGSVSRGQNKYPANMHYEMQLKYDPENAVIPRTASTSRIELKNVKKCVYFYTAAGDFSAVRKIVFAAWLRYPIHFETLRVLLFSLRLRRPFKIYGPAGIRLFPTEGPIRQNSNALFN